MTLAYSIKVQIKGNLKNSSHLSVSFYNERNKNFFFKYRHEINVYYFDNFQLFINFQSNSRIFLNISYYFIIDLLGKEHFYTKIKITNWNW